MIAVVIPFYQKQPGLLYRALVSVAEQYFAEKLQILVVDDGSPSPSESELKGLPRWLAARVRILHQPNGGAAAARNLALEALSSDVETVAFLDSDDVWTADHLAHVRTARRAGAQFYFSDHWRTEDPQTRFSQCGFKADGAPIGGGNAEIAWCQASRIMQEIVRRSPVGTSTVAVDRAFMGGLRFPTMTRAAGEDSLFWLALLCRGPAVGCGSRCEAYYGQGVSIFNHRSWGDERSLHTTLDEMRTLSAFRSFFPGDRKTTSLIAERCRDLDIVLGRAMLACARRRCWRGIAPSKLYIKSRPQALLRLPAALRRAIRARMSHGAPSLPPSRTG